MLKLAGITIIVISSFAAAIYNAKKQTKLLRINEAMLDFVIYIKHRIEFFRETLDDIYSSYENEALESAGFLNLLPEIGFKKSLIKISDYLTGKSKNALNDFGQTLGKSCFDEQKISCELCITLLEDELDKIRSEIPQKNRVASSLCITVGIAAALLLI